MRTREQVCTRHPPATTVSILLHPLEPVVSRRLLTSSRAERQAVLEAAEASSGLSDLEQLFAVPSLAVTRMADAAWMGGRPEPLRRAHAAPTLALERHANTHCADDDNCSYYRPS
jgi:hypothetical protein